MNPPAFSVIIPTYQRATVLPRAVASVLAQTWTDFELLVVDDGSTDHTPRYLESLDDPRVRPLRQENRGVCAARNRGLREARAPWVTFLDSDDEAEPEWLASFREVARRERVGIVTAGARVVERGDGGGTHRGFVEPNYSPLCDCRIRATAGCMATRRDLLLDIGGYAEELRYGENSELAIRLLALCEERGLEVAVIDRPLVVYHRDPSAWRQGDRAFRALRHSAEHILEHHGDRLRARFPGGYANYRGVAAVNAARLGDVAAARRHLWAALKVEPRRLRTYLRLALTCAPPLARRYWRRHGDDAGGEP